MIPAVIVDTNVVVAGLLTKHADSPVARMLDGMLHAAFAFVVSNSLLAEYRNVLHRPAIRKAHGLDDDEIEILMVALAEHAIVLTPVATGSAPDPGDQHLWELLATRTDLRLVTGGKLLLDQPGNEKRVITPAAFVELWMQASP